MPSNLLFVCRLLGGGWIIELASICPLLASICQPDFGKRAEAECFFLTIDAVLAPPQLATRRGDEQVQTVTVVELVRLVSRLRVADFLNRKHLGVSLGRVFYTPDHTPKYSVNKGENRKPSEKKMLSVFD